VTTGAAIDLLMNTMLIVVQVAGPLLLAALIAGLIMGVLQAATQVNEMSITFVVKIAAVGVTFVFLSGWLFSTVVDHTHRSFESIATVLR
jgi:flagellar biosynthetic protein FliQ